MGNSPLQVAGSLKSFARRGASSIVGLFGFELVRKGLGYFDARDVVPKARAARQTICEYVEGRNLGGVGKRRDRVIDALKDAGLLAPCEAIVEIGAGTGMYLEKTLEHCRPASYEVYETSGGWSRFLAEEYGSRTRLTCHVADGRTLRQTSSASVDLVLAHGVFVYLPIILTIAYLDECVRICRPGGLIVFDCFLDQRFGIEVVDAWRKERYQNVFPVLMPGALLEGVAARHALELMARFEVPYHASESTYFGFRKSASS